MCARSNGLHNLTEFVLLHVMVHDILFHVMDVSVIILGVTVFDSLRLPYMSIKAHISV